MLEALQEEAREPNRHETGAAARSATSILSFTPPFLLEWATSERRPAAFDTELYPIKKRALDVVMREQGSVTGDSGRLFILL